MATFIPWHSLTIPQHSHTSSKKYASSFVSPAQIKATTFRLPHTSRWLTKQFKATKKPQMSCGNFKFRPIHLNCVDQTQLGHWSFNDDIFCLQFDTTHQPSCVWPLCYVLWCHLISDGIFHCVRTSGRRWKSLLPSRADTCRPVSIMSWTLVLRSSISLKGNFHTMVLIFPAMFHFLQVLKVLHSLQRPGRNNE